jgi:hypothetical protein
MTTTTIPEGRNEDEMHATVQAALIAVNRSVRAGDDGQLVDSWRALERVIRTQLPKSEAVEEEDLAALWDAAADLPKATLASRADGKALLYDSKIHWLAGEPGSGKSWVALLWVLEQVRAGKHAVFVDFESDPLTVVGRLRALGIDQEHLPFVHYLRVRFGEDLAGTVASMVTIVERHDTSLVVLDGLATALAQLGFDENSNSDVSRFTEHVLRPLSQAGPAVVVVDHMAKPQQGAGAGRYARGAGAKLADASGVAYVLEVAVPFSKAKPGIAKLRVGKDRNGDVGAAGEVVAEFHFTPSEEGLSILTSAPDPGQSSGRWIPSVFMAKVSAHLATAKTATATELKEFVGKKGWENHGGTIRTLLEKHGYVTVDQQGRSHVWTHVKLFTDDDAETVRTAEFGAPDGGSPQSKNFF